MEGLARATGQPLVSEFDLARARTVARALARVSPEADRSLETEDAVRLILFEMWRPIGSATAEREVEPLLAGSWAGEVLAGMKAHQQARREAWRHHAENQLRQEQQRGEKQHLKQEQHAERLQRKKERDRLWRERQGNIESDRARATEQEHPLVGSWVSSDKYATEVEFAISRNGDEFSVRAIDRSDGEEAEIYDVKWDDIVLSFAAHWSTGRFAKYRLVATSRTQIDVICTFTLTEIWHRKTS